MLLYISKFSITINFHSTNHAPDKPVDTKQTLTLFMTAAMQSQLPCVQNTALPALRPRYLPLYFLTADPIPLESRLSFSR
jgi:hypothetical protein